MKKILGRGGAQSVSPIFVCEDRAISWAIFHEFIYRSVMCTMHIRPPPIITKLNYVKNGPIFKTITQKFFFQQSA